MLSQNVDQPVDSDEESDNLAHPQRAVTRKTAKAASVSLFGLLPPVQRPRVSTCGSVKLTSELRKISESTAAGSLDSLDWDPHRKTTELSDGSEQFLFALGDDDLFSDSESVATPDTTPEVSPVKRTSTRTVSSSSHGERADARARLAQARARLDQDVPGHRQLQPALVKRLLDRATRHDRRLSDTTIRASLNLPPRPRRVSSDIMANIKELVTTHRSNVQLAFMEIADDIQTVDFDHSESAHIRSRLSIADANKKVLQTAIVFLTQHDNAFYVASLQEQVINAKQVCIDYIKNAQIYLRREVDEVSTENRESVRLQKAAAALRRDRVLLNQKKTVDDLDDLAATMQELGMAQPVTDKDFDLLQSKCEQHGKIGDQLLKDAQALHHDAVSGAMKPEALEIDTAVQRYKGKNNDLQKKMIAHREKFEITASRRSLPRNSDLKCPVFSGVGHPDFYTFKTEFDEYVTTQSWTALEYTRMLKRAALQGAPKELASDMDNSDEIWKILKLNYGVAGILIADRKKEIRKVGRCTGSAEKRREWAIDIHSKLTRLHAICKTHSKHDDLYHSEIFGDVRRALPDKAQTDFQDEVIQWEEDNEKDATRSELFHMLLAFLQTFIQKETSILRFEMIDRKDEPAAKPVLKVQPPPPDPGQGTRQPKYPQKPKTLVANQVASLPPVPQPQSGVKSKRKKPSKTQTAMVGQLNNPPQAVQGPVFCNDCQTSHEYVFYCKSFQQKDCEHRIKMSSSLKTCFRCLRSDANMTFIQRNKWWEDHKPRCDGKFSCTHGPCGRRDESRQRHILMCEFHVDENKKRESEFLKTLDQALLPKNVKFFFHSAMISSKVKKVGHPGQIDGFDIIQDNDEPALYMLHTVKGAGGENLTVFYDTGCDGASLNNKAYDNLDCQTVRPGPTMLNVAGGATIELEHGDEQFFLEMAAGKKKAAVTAIRMNTITDVFPYRLLAAAFSDIQQGYIQTNPKGPPLPEVDKAVGGTPVDIMLGIKYYHLFPKLLFMLPGGLAIHEAQLKTASGRLGVLAGTHKSWQMAASRAHTMTARAYFTSELRAYQFQCESLHFHDGFVSANVVSDDEVCLDENFSSSVATSSENSAKEEFVTWSEKPACTQRHCSQHNDWLNRWRAKTDWELGNAAYSMNQDEAKFWQTEDSGTTNDYRCVACRNCARCRDGGSLEMISLKDESEQAMLESIVVWNPAKQQLETGLPFVEDPEVHLKSNRYIAEKVLDSQVKLINKTPGMKEGVLISHGKLLTRGFVVPYDDLPDDIKEIMDSSAGPGYFIPWTVVFKASSISTPVRMVFNGSSSTPGGKSLNAILAKGMNTLARLLELVIRFRLKRFAFTADVRMAYNGIKITPPYYKYQKYLWKEDLDPLAPYMVMVILTLIYGIRPSGQLTIAGFNVLADEVDRNYPEHSDGADVMRKDTYLDDIMRAVHTHEDMFKQARSVAFTLDLGGMSVKAFTYAGQKPDPEVSNDGVHIGAVGYRWASEADYLCLDVKPMSFGKAKRGKLPEEIKGDFGPDLLQHFTRRTLVGKLMSIFDPTGLVTPITAKLKLDLHDLVDLKLDWDDAIPVSFFDVWVKNLKDIQLLNDITFKRTIMPDNAANDKIRLIVSCDASEKIAIATVHTQIELLNGGFHVSLLAAKSKLVKGASIPKGELKGAVLASVLFHVTRRNCGDRFDDVLFVTDSTICLYWIQQDYRPLKATVRNSVIEIRRFSSPEQWYHLDGKMNIADLGTRPTEVADISPGSEWQNGPDWMKLDRDMMPLKTAKEVTLSAEEKKEAAMELKAPDISSHLIKGLTDKIAERYSFSKYLVDPCSRPWPKVVRIIATLHRFIDNLRNKTRTKPTGTPAVGLIFSQDETKRAEEYFFRKCTLEVRQFSKEKDFKENSFLKDKILRHTGRLLDEQELGTMESLVTDLPPLKFVNPIIDRYSPVAYSIMIYCHRNISRHRNSAATLRDSLDIAYILGGRDLSNEVRDSCPHCKIFKKKLLEVEMGSLHPNRLMVAYPFWFTELDLMGPFIARCEHSCRSDKKVWGLVLKCPTTGAIDVRAMQAQSADAFMNAFSRFAHRFGFPTKIYCDKGSQLIAGCEGMNFTLMDLEKDLALKFNTGIEYNTVAVGMHNANGVVERSIKEVKKLFAAVYRGFSLDILNYETAFSFCANELNNIPVCLGSRYRGLSHQDLLSPNRLLMGRNNTRSPVGIPNLHGRTRLLDQNEDLFKAWWNVWKTERLIEYIPQPQKWQKTGYQPKQGDIVIFPRRDAEKKLGVPPWVVGQVHAALVDSDLQVRAVEIEYKNATEDHFRYTERGVRTVAVLHEEGDLEMMEQLADAARTATRSFLMSTNYGYT